MQIYGTILKKKMKGRALVYRRCNVMNYHNLVYFCKPYSTVINQRQSCLVI